MPIGRPREFDTEKALELAASLSGGRATKEHRSRPDRTLASRGRASTPHSATKGHCSGWCSNARSKAGAYRTKALKAPTASEVAQQLWKEQPSFTAIKVIRSVASPCMVRWRAATKPR
jgi:hypothetical protein